MKGTHIYTNVENSSLIRIDNTASIELMTAALIPGVMSDNTVNSQKKGEVSLTWNLSGLWQIYEIACYIYIPW